jgi:predicted component of type VI protein secretion system
MKGMETEIGFLVSKMEKVRKTNREEMKATVKSILSEVDETIQQQVGNIMTHNQETQSLQKA